MDIEKINPKTKEGKKAQNDHVANVLLANRPFILVSAPISCGKGYDEIIAVATAEGGTEEELMKSIVSVMECHDGFRQIIIEAVGRYCYLQAIKADKE